MRLLPHSFHRAYDGATETNRNEDWFDYDDFRFRFTALARCDNDHCSETSAVAGSGSLHEDPDDEAHQMEYSELFTATYVSPSPALITVPEDCPDVVTQQVRRADVAQWGDYEGALTHLRTAVERLLDAQGVIAKRTTTKGSAYLTLHSRIEFFRAHQPSEADALLAAKWLGNAGAHNDEVTRSDVFDMYDILERVLNGLYGHASTVERLIRTINSAKGPVRDR
ncbi:MULTISPECIES: DUF4145 domain-containing protein [unclassified Variovorax]|uniref:DUF4145 domain-containing protein n=1 Tax=unclassified Variovorax TaxID=663243 RepID=UPI0002B63C80|nr:MULTISPECIES: DUF4145 domain-containing protein [unclassified Variovorax]AGF25476.1 hypothetical protein [Variovorax sp. WDL1]PNG50557.1 hypothetical protein CHC06_06181 [Variovorax sp. B2]PNG51426.1 hypothetical protein CHC07_06083 [Variovorax sp. B4]VTU42187.1 hypothetical protein RA8P1_00173 [Variovorax sp. RA8]VTV17725.1 hypothetical protein WDL1P1_00616 [Variovorax sp. WDL1]